MFLQVCVCSSAQLSHPSPYALPSTPSQPGPGQGTNPFFSTVKQEDCLVFFVSKVWLHTYVSQFIHNTYLIVLSKIDTKAYKCPVKIKVTVSGFQVWYNFTELSWHVLVFKLNWLLFMNHLTFWTERYSDWALLCKDLNVSDLQAANLTILCCVRKSWKSSYGNL